MTLEKLDALLKAESDLLKFREEVLEMLYAGPGEASNAGIDGMIKQIFELGFDAGFAAAKNKYAILTCGELGQVRFQEGYDAGYAVGRPAIYPPVAENSAQTFRGVL